MKTKEIRQKKDKELQNMLAEKREQLRVLNFGLANNEIKNHREGRQLKRDIAQLLTVIRENEYLGRAKPAALDDNSDRDAKKSGSFAKSRK